MKKKTKKRSSEFIELILKRARNKKCSRNVIRLRAVKKN